MNIETHRRSIIHRILDIQNETILHKIDDLLNKEGYVFSISGELLSEEAYKKEIQSILSVSEDREGYTSENIRKKLFKR